MARPIVILAFSNDLKHHLPHLDEEADSLHRMFLSLQDKEIIDLRYYPNTTVKLLSDDLRDLKNRKIAIFHYGGHAEPSHLNLEEESFFLEHVAPLMVKYWRPRLVFLNGCSTSGMAQKLFQAGIKMVVATEEAVNDLSAKNFAENFYKSLIKGLSVWESFEYASKFYRASKREVGVFRFPNSRNLILPQSHNKVQEQDLPWILTFGKHKRTVRLPRFFRRKTDYRAFALILIICALLISVPIALREIKLHTNLPTIISNESIPPDTVSPPALQSLSSRQVNIRFVDQTGSKLEFNPDKDYQISIGNSKHSLQGWEGQYQINPEETVQLLSDGIYYSSPGTYTGNQSSLDIYTCKIVFRIDDTDLEDSDLPLPSYFGLENLQGDSLKISVNHHRATPYEDTVLVPFQFPIEGKLRFWMDGKYDIRTEFCHLNQRSANRNIPCIVRFCPGYED